MEQAIKKAIKEGWKVPEDYEDDVVELATRYWQDTCLDPLFWQALFKEYISGLPFKIQDRTLPQWRQQWHRFIDHLAEGKDAESFFAEIMK